MSALKSILDPKPSHILKAEQMADAIYNEPNTHHIEMMEAITNRLIERNKSMLEKLRKFNN